MEINRLLLEKYNVPVPRYTSYPPANHFNQAFTDQAYIQQIEESNTCQPENIALYIHIPFCKKMCYYCGCNMMLYKGEQWVREYIEALKKEITHVSSSIDKNRKVSQIHYGGGTPNAIDVNYLEEINHLLFELFAFISNPEIAIECHPAHLDEEYIHRLLQAGFNRFSLGIQDFNTTVLKTVNRNPSVIPVGEIASMLKQYNSAISVNLDFIYGLPGQTVNEFLQTIEQAISIRPNRLVTFSYAHVPWLKKHQQILEKKGLMTSTEKLDLFLQARSTLLSSGYESIGLDHYVLPGDELNQALQQNQLHRNFQGYCTRRTTGQVYAFGASSISQLENVYIQNEKETGAYIVQINEKNTAVNKGLVLSFEQKIIRAVIERIMCNKVLDLDAFCNEHHLNYEDFTHITQFHPDKLSGLIADKLIHFEHATLHITEIGSFFIRNIAAVFDPAYQQQTNKYSKSV